MSIGGGSSAHRTSTPRGLALHCSRRQAGLLSRGDGADDRLAALDARHDIGTSRQALVVHEVVCKTRELDRARDRVARDLRDVLLLRLARPPRQGGHGIQHFARQVRFPQLLGGDRGVLQDFV